MIKDIIIYKNKIILTVYHRGFSEENFGLRHIRKEHIGKSVILFQEECVADDEWDRMTGYAWEEKALVPPKEKYSPYRGRACANMVHRIYPDKPSVIWKNSKVVPDEREAEELIMFIQKYTGMNLEDVPVFLGDSFLFSASEFRYHTNEADAIILYGLEAGMKIVLKFRKGEAVQQTELIDITEKTDKLEISTDGGWDKHDIDIYKEGKLIYSNRDVSYVKCMHFTMSFAGGKRRIPLTTLQEYYELEQQNRDHESIIGTPPEPVRETLGELNRMFVRRLRNQKDTTGFLFIRPGELDIAMEKVAKVIFAAEEEIWLIDAYFTDKGSGLQQMTDWLRLTVNSPAKEKHVIFYCNTEEKALNAAQLKAHIKEDPVMEEGMMRDSFGRLHLYQTKMAIHDRFLIIRNGDTYSGLSIGTSFNSLNSNHYCIHTLTHRAAKEVTEVLGRWLQSNVAAQEDCTYDNG